MKEFQPHIMIDIENQLVHIFLEECESYSEWIKGEEAHVALKRAMDDNRVVGALLPLKNWNGKFPVIII